MNEEEAMLEREKWREEREAKALAAEACDRTISIRSKMPSMDAVD